MAQAGIPDATQIDLALAEAPRLIEALVSAS
jgi:hypothetical protein